MGTAVDGELVAFDEMGHLSFNAIQNASADANIVFFVFDVLVLRASRDHPLLLSASFADEWGTFPTWPIFEDGPVFDRVAIAGVVTDPRVSKFECTPARLLRQQARGSARSSELRSISSMPSFTATAARAVLR